MLRHIVLITYTDAATEAERAAHQSAVAAFAQTDPEVRALSCGPNVGKGPNHHDFAMVADFDDMAAFRRYMEGDTHAAYVAAHRGVIAKLAAIQHEV